jgi:hypothetical protein
MTARPHDHRMTALDSDDVPQDPIRRPHVASNRPRWLVPGTIGVVIAAGLVVAGVVPLGTMISLTLFGGMMLTHVGGHGMHGGHSSPGRGHLRDEERASALAVGDGTSGPPQRDRSPRDNREGDEVDGGRMSTETERRAGAPRA